MCAPEHPLSSKLSLLLAILLTATPVMANADAPLSQREQADLVGSVGLVLGGVGGATLIGGGMAAWGLASLQRGGCRDAGCEGPFGLLLMAPVGALAGAVGGALVGYLVAVSSQAVDEAPGTPDRDIEDDLE